MTDSTDRKPHTPTPWVVRRFPSYTAGARAWVMDATPDGPTGQVFADLIASPTTSKNSDANMAFIVRACNAHDELLAACRTFAERLDYLQELWGAEGFTTASVQKLRQAIELAEGGAK